MLGAVVFVLGGLCLLLVWVGLGSIAYDVVFLGQLGGLLVKFVVLGVVYVFGVGLASLSRARFDQPLFLLLARGAAWVYLALVWITYLGIILVMDGLHYSVLEYLTFLVLLAIELLALGGLRLITSERPSPLFALSLLVIVLFQLLLIVYRYVFTSAPLSAFLAGDLVLLLSMAIVSSAMLGEDAFKAFIERFIKSVG